MQGEGFRVSEDTRRQFLQWKARLLNVIFFRVITPEVESDRQLVWNAINATYNLWVEAFTDWSISYKSQEKLEFEGDAIIHRIMSRYLLEEFKQLDHDQLSTLRSYYTSNVFQGTLVNNMTTTLPPINEARGLFVGPSELAQEGHPEPVPRGQATVDGNPPEVVGSYENSWYKNYYPSDITNTWVDGRLQDLVRYDKAIFGREPPPKIQDDVYEALIASICRCGDYYVPGLGEVWVIKFVRIMMKDKVDTSHAAGDPKNILEKIFTRFGKAGGSEDGIQPPSVIPYPRTNPDGTTYIEAVVTMSRSSYNFLKKDFVRKHSVGLTEENRRNIASMPPNEELGRAENYNVSEAQKEACEIALRVLAEKYGITDEWASKNKDIFDGIFMNGMYKDSRGTGLYTLLLQTLVDRGYKDDNGNAWFMWEKDSRDMRSITGTKIIMRLIGFRRVDGVEVGDILKVYAGGPNRYLTTAQLYALWLADNGINVEVTSVLQSTR